MDKRNQFKNERWQQGHLLITETTKNWTVENRRMADEHERLRLFARFESQDEGRGRILLHVYSTAAECAVAVEEHNRMLP